MDSNPKPVTAVNQSQSPDGWHAESWQALLVGNYEKVANFYEELIEQNPEVAEHYWYLGLVYLLSGDEEKAQLTWFVALSEFVDAETEQAPDGLVDILHQEASRQESLANNEMAWLIRGHLRGFSPAHIDNLLSLFCLDFELRQPQNLDRFSDWNILDILSKSSINISDDLLFNTLKIVLNFPMFDSVAFSRIALTLTKEKTKFEDKILEIASTFCYDKGYPSYAIDLVKVCVDQNPSRLDLITELYWFNASIRNFDGSLDAAKLFLEHSQTVAEEVFGQFYYLHTSLSRSDWTYVLKHHEKYLEDLLELSRQTDIPKSMIPWRNLTTCTQILLYIHDNPQQNRYLTNQIARLFQDNVNSEVPTETIPAKEDIAPHNNLLIKERPLKIGYIASSFYNHSVGWLCRWLLKHHNQEQFSTYLYSLDSRPDDYLRTWFKNNVTEFKEMGRAIKQVVKQIQKDEIDILIDLDSVTFNLTCQVMALKPAPIQVTWLGNDASGIPAIDYFIADPYVLPDNASQYYSEKIWRLPHTYLGVDGFEVGVPSLRREDLSIPNNAIIYANFQNTLKRHPHIIEQQMKILQAVPNSFLLVKTTGKTGKIEEIWNQFKIIGDKLGISLERLRFLDRFPSEMEHRANLAIIDVMLDTYPYNGATSTLETLWMEIPLVTKVGEPFAARNSYTFMINAGITEGIAWTDEEYLEWGVKLGTDENLRKEISWKLRQAKKTSPLWNGKQFAHDMENAYRQMWEIYVQENY